MRRELLPSYAIVGVGLICGLLVGGVLTDAEPAVLGWLLGAGVGLTAGAFVAAILGEVPLAGSRREESAPRADGTMSDALAHLRVAPGAGGDPAEAAAAYSPGDDGNVGLAGLGRGGNGRAL